MAERKDLTMRRTSGFTLIELLVVISIISLLVAMLLPSVEKARASGEQILCATNLRQMGVAMEAYINEWDDWMPYYEAWFHHHYRSRLRVDPGGGWFHAKGYEKQGAVINGYLTTSGDEFNHVINVEQGLWCPSHPGQTNKGYMLDWPIPRVTWWATEWHWASYGYNYDFLGSQWVHNSNATKWFYRKKSWVRFPSNILTHADNAYSFPPTNTNYQYHAEVHRTAQLNADQAVDWDMVPDFRDELTTPIGERHIEGANVVCLDGHADFHSQIKWHSAEFDHRWREPGAKLKRLFPN